MRRLEGRSALVTGATRGIGLAIARGFAREGARVLVGGRSAADCAAVAEALRGGALGVPGDLAHPDGARTLGEAALEAADGAVDILVNNAGQARVVPAAELAVADWQATLDLNLTAGFVLAQVLGRAMLARGRGSIVNVSSVNGSVAFPNRLAYCVSKAGLNMLTKVLAVEWARAGVRVNAVAPSYVETPMIGDLAARGALDRSALAHRTPAGRLGTPEEIAAAVVFLASDEAAFITGTVLAADGGWSAYGFV